MAQYVKYMERALVLAQKAESLGEVPVGAVVVFEGQIVGEGYNLRETENDPLAHAEIRAIAAAAAKLGRWRLSGCTLLVTLEPCLMCSGAIVNSRVDTVVFGATDPKAGAVVSLYQTLSDVRLNHRPTVVPGVLADTASQLLKDFFKRRRTEV